MSARPCSPIGKKPTRPSHTHQQRKEITTMQSTDSPDLTIATPIGDVRLYASEQDRASMWLDHIMVNRIEYSLHGDIERRAPYPRNIYTRRVLAPGDYGKTEPTPGASRTIYAAVRAMIAGLTDAQWGALNR